MDVKLRYRCVEEIGAQMRLANLGWDQLKASLLALDAYRTFFYAEGFLRHAAAVSRMLWPEREASAERGQVLRELLKVPEDSALKLPEVRSWMVSGDAAFEDWVERLGGEDFVDVNIMPQGTIADYQQDTFLRSLDPESMEWSCCGVRCPLRKVFDALKDLDRAVQAWLKTNHPW